VGEVRDVMLECGRGLQALDLPFAWEWEIRLLKMGRGSRVGRAGMEGLSTSGQATTSPSKSAEGSLVGPGEVARVNLGSARGNPGYWRSAINLGEMAVQSRWASPRRVPCVFSLSIRLRPGR